MNTSKIAFAIITNSKRPDQTKLTIKSIKNTCQNNVDIHIGGVVHQFKDDNIILHDLSDLALSGQMGKFRNTLIDSIEADIIVCCDDDIIFPKSWYDNFIQWSSNNDFNIMTNKIYLPNGGRFWDRFIIDDDIITMIDYGTKDHRLTLCSAMFVINKKFFDRNKFNPDLKYYGGNNKKEFDLKQWKLVEDVEYGRRITSLGYTIEFDSTNHVFHNDFNYNQIYSLGSKVKNKNICASLKNTAIEIKDKTKHIVKRYDVWKNFVAEMQSLDYNPPDISEQFSLLEKIKLISQGLAKRKLTEDENFYISILVNDDSNFREIKNKIKYILANPGDEENAVLKILYEI